MGNLYSFKKNKHPSGFSQEEVDAFRAQDEGFAIQAFKLKNNNGAYTKEKLIELAEEAEEEGFKFLKKIILDVIEQE